MQGAVSPDKDRRVSSLSLASRVSLIPENSVLLQNGGGTHCIATISLSVDHVGVDSQAPWLTGHPAVNVGSGPAHLKKRICVSTPSPSPLARVSDQPCASAWASAKDEADWFRAAVDASFPAPATAYVLRFFFHVREAGALPFRCLRVRQVLAQSSCHLLFFWPRSSACPTKHRLRARSHLNLARLGLVVYHDKAQ